MGLWGSQSSLFRQYENKSLQNHEYEKVKNRMESTHSFKKSAVMILAGILFTIILTAFEYALKNPEISKLLRTVFQVGFFGSLIGVFLIPYGLYNCIISFKRN